MIIKILFLLSSFLLLCNASIMESSELIYDYDFKKYHTFELDEEHTIYVLRSHKKDFNSIKKKFTISSEVKFNKISYLFSDIFYEEYNVLEEFLIKADYIHNTKDGKNIYDFYVKNGNANDYFYLVIELKTPPEKPLYINISLIDYTPSDDKSSSSFTWSQILKIIVFSLVGLIILVISCVICIVVTKDKGCSEGCKECCYFCGECCKCFEECCRCFGECLRVFH